MIEVLETLLTCRLCIVDRGEVKQVFTPNENKKKKDFVTVSAAVVFLHLVFVVWKAESRNRSL